jgi:DNA topoisomerase-2
LRVNSSETEIIISVDENDRLLQFERAEDIIPYFCKFRLSWYEKRKKHIIDMLMKEILVLGNRAKFIKAIIDKKLKVSNVPKKEICDWLENKKFDKVSNSFDYLINMPIYSLTKERYAELLKEYDAKKLELEIMKKRVPADMYLDDLKSLKKSLKN